MTQTFSTVKLSNAIIFIAFICMHMRSAQLLIVQDGLNTIHLYQRLKNAEPPTESDSAFASPRSRYEFCKDITRKEFTYWNYLKLVKRRKLRQTLEQPRYSHILNRVFTRTLIKDRYQRSSYAYKYTNEYRPLQFFAINFSHTEIFPTFGFPVNEYVFVCVMKNVDDKVVPLYVSKEYNLSSSGSYKAGRFIFPRTTPTSNQYHVLLVEEPATVYKGLGHNVERLYLETRKHHRPAFDKDLDPICKLVQPDVTKNQCHRICKEILLSVYFRNRVTFSWWQPCNNCSEREISFKTEEARREAAGRIYSENMISCEGRSKRSNGRISYYISRAYRSHEVFVYNVDRSTGDDKVYLENLTINVNVVEEALGFEDVE